MLAAGYNPSQMGDILVVILHQDTKQQSVKINKNVVKIFDPKQKITLGFNFLDASHVLPDLKGKNGEIHLTNDDLSKLNQAIKNAGFNDQLKQDPIPRFVVGYVKTCKQHPDSSKLKITQTEIDGGKTVQIVSGSPNMKQGIKVVVAKVGAMMPNGLIIWPSKLKGVESNGMICAGYELRIPGAPQHPGALILPDSYKVGEPFDFKTATKLFK
ncbi:YtpR family tRNA-binding protein [Acetilactobacillus jinshanensis]|uniref:DUF4479 domain-containing protein n=1 Tax=Acetilactobacillus jinshanensis TaxID=1720083 RepID=A0A4P6ZMM1_9LACO|nr:DUF4479 and tRNA-binding domain-containing protein [Acetilactobacillus jinshanensis]QBP18682.1 DUF4479 domain-containing protein [Acetilactobacillus jinshanensis]URL61558.1 DUF4479 and tRNA-binding domain-containing protein [uncultured bacterium]